MFFRGLFLSLVSFFTIIGIISFITFAEHRLPRLLLPFLPFFGILLFFIALWTHYLYITVIFCSAAITFFYAAHRLKRIGGCRSAGKYCNTKRHPRF